MFVQFGSFGIGGVVDYTHWCHTSKALSRYSRQMHRELTAEFCQLVCGSVWVWVCEREGEGRERAREGERERS